MDLSAIIFEQPKLRKGVSANVEGHSIDVNYRDQGCDIYCEDVDPSRLHQFLGALTQGEHTYDQLKQEFVELADYIEEILLEFDRLGLLEEAAAPQVGKVLSGRDFYFSRLLPTISNVQYRLGDSPVHERILAQTITKNELIGFALEYYHLVKMAPGLIGPSIPHVGNEAIRTQLLKLFVEEYDHDKMMIDCLKAEGINENDILKRQPLASSFCAYASLGVYARQHILSFYSALILFESPSHQFNHGFIDAAKRLGMSEAFYKPLVKHSDINEDGKHDEITLNLLSQVPVISEQEQDTILIHITALIEMQHKQGQHIVEYYGNENNDMMRVFG